MFESHQDEVTQNLYVAILRNELPDSGNDWIQACRNKNLAYDLIDLSAADWFERITARSYDFVLLYPSGNFERYKTMYDERVQIVCNQLGLKAYPGYDECIIYENKKMLSYFLQCRSIPHPRTWVFYNYDEAVAFCNQTDLPFVAKTAIGAAGSGVKIIKDTATALSYVKLAFRGKGIKRRFGPNRVTGNPKKWFTKALHSPSYFFRKLAQYLEVNSNAQFGYVIFQEYIHHDYEWRIVKIGDSFFAHRKMKVMDKASGGKVKTFGMPDNAVMDFVEGICRKNALQFVCVDVFESPGGYLVNEIQTVFGIPYGYLMKVGDEVGRIRKLNGVWTFEAGDFTSNHCFDLRLNYILHEYV